jgi:hypothetical protein
LTGRVGLGTLDQIIARGRSGAEAGGNADLIRAAAALTG